jgi:hypothetical protein
MPFRRLAAQRSAAALRAVTIAMVLGTVLVVLLAGVPSDQKPVAAVPVLQHDFSGAAGASGASGAVFDPGSIAATAATGAAFDPGYILSDDVLSDSRSLTEEQVQAFIAEQAPGCAFTSATTCLRAYHSALPSRPASDGGECAALEGAPGGALASRIVFRVARACHINPKVLLVMLQKEQGLITTVSPTYRAYRVAMGYGCPDSAACETEFYGFAAQVYRAAKQLRNYLLDPGYWRYRVGPVAVQFSPRAACGAEVVNIRNPATAALYNYTPYQPNAAALANPRGQGDECSSYGNRNFWVFFTEWFGSPTEG